MFSNYSIDYVVFPKHNTVVSTYLTDDPIAAEEFLMHLLIGHADIREIRHGGAVLTGHSLDRMLKIAAERIASGLLRESLHIDAEETKARFGFAA